MQSTAVPATLVVQTTWTGFTLYRNPAPVEDGTSIKTDYSANLTFATHQFLGDTEGAPIAVVKMNQNASGRYLEPTQTVDADLLGEVVTRADGTEIKLIDLLDLKLNAAIQPLSN